jgi:hypothetical protein|uniref:Uncharacterized protein n=1 Tax=Bionectria ochroleuca TaxID=29856 RepID=A0A8H7TMX1_BIOOC
MGELFAITTNLDWAALLIIHCSIFHQPYRQDGNDLTCTTQSPDPSPSPVVHPGIQCRQSSPGLPPTTNSPAMVVSEDQGTKNSDLIIAVSEHARKPVWQE